MAVAALGRGQPARCSRADTLPTKIAAGLVRWEAAIRDGLQAMHDRGELDADPERLALALLAALQGGLLLTQIQRRVKPLEAALDQVLDHIESCLTSASRPVVGAS